jgi:hypothetical protein
LNYGFRGRLSGWRDASAGTIRSAVVSAQLRLAGNDQQQRQTDEKQQREQHNSVQFVFPMSTKIITHGQVELQLAQRGVINDVIDCSFESSDDATVTILAQAPCQDAIKRSSRCGNTVLAIFLFAIATKETTSNLNGFLNHGS